MQFCWAESLTGTQGLGSACLYCMCGSAVSSGTARRKIGRVLLIQSVTGIARLTGQAVLGPEASEERGRQRGEETGPQAT
ncbi:hypothetical protein BO99DRAFT_403850 [Aspergillus violaceofuscus CBS 115571]|uniref:Uncharacterized protein n=1 Tax=Aspergillus violaceofuscus (strain CBS 115571) TaxID=1450538 RepID=A0A2V5H3H8_ASPV1|nr:hypothetical protein BO99DRAFT_403850 [Aspergillus violaceofuscus CBS 115571]